MRRTRLCQTVTVGLLVLMVVFNLRVLLNRNEGAVGSEADVAQLLKGVFLFVVW